MNKQIYPRVFLLESNPTHKLTFFFTDKEPLTVYIQSKLSFAVLSAQIRDSFHNDIKSVMFNSTGDNKYILCISLTTLDYFEVKEIEDTLA